VGRVDDVEDHVRGPGQEIIAGLQFRGIDGGQGVNPGQVHAGDFFPLKHHLADVYFTVVPGSWRPWLIAAETIKIVHLIRLADELFFETFELGGRGQWPGASYSSCPRALRRGTYFFAQAPAWALEC
jgi:hypothetical protein